MGPCSPCPGERNPNRDCRHRKTPPHSRRPTCRRAPSLPKTRGGSPQQALISNRSKECGGECGTMVFVTIAGVSFGSSSRAGRSLGRRRPASVPRRLRPNPRQTYFVILSVSEGSIWGKVTDSSSIFRSPQNDNAVFALNHFRSGTHSSARPGRLRGSRLWARAGPGRKVFRIRKSLRDMPAIIVILSEADRRTQRVQRPLADYAEQGGERQTKCSQESILGKVTDSSSLCSSE